MAKGDRRVWVNLYLPRFITVFPLMVRLEELNGFKRAQKKGGEFRVSSLFQFILRVVKKSPRSVRRDFATLSCRFENDDVLGFGVSEFDFFQSVILRTELTGFFPSSLYFLSAKAKGSIFSHFYALDRVIFWHPDFCPERKLTIHMFCQSFPSEISSKICAKAAIFLWLRVHRFLSLPRK